MNLVTITNDFATRKFLHYPPDEGFARRKKRGKPNKEQFAWPQISNLKNTREDPVYKAYKLHWIPAFYVVCPEGKIVGSAITTEELRTLLKSLL